MISFCDIINCTHFFDLIYYLINWKTSSKRFRNIHFSCLRLLLTYFHLIFFKILFWRNFKSVNFGNVWKMTGLAITDTSIPCVRKRLLPRNLNNFQKCGNFEVNRLIFYHFSCFELLPGLISFFLFKTEKDH